ncbi:Peptidoglycan/xylan/chitin deacetylase, PgdA/CDA1 family [Micromonospora pallida]|uniref:Peptidoglycan/xylan/chitin deacetylase, PgdA/CDA1 family n=1 Tax=Micromonospora pallida TaxID=145854 RepID=A0A1C6T8K9_9ACTN|nr:polysaccharide deacetylase family protein [Micromonospora pallida]SCL38088.1 Peptidoglycan/xylan/chitin deacetylase, PgdA/CDA1 family [Micromonospora pallida]
MTPRALAAAGAALLLLLAGCGEQTGVHSVGPAAPVFSQPAETPPAGDPTPSGVPSPSPSTPKASPKPTRTALPTGLRRSTGTRGVALTFDDGPDPVWTPKVLDQLRRHRVTATFCVVGTQVRQHPGLVARIVREGHQLCNHSWRHDVDLGSRSRSAIRADLDRTTRAIRAAAPGAKVPFYRQPGGRWTPEVVAVARDLGMTPLHWTVDPRDWAKPTAATITARVRSGLRPGSVVLLHDGGGNRAATVAACPAMIADIKRRYGVTRLR